MALVCSSCGKENRDKARFCRGCARPLVAPGGNPDADAAQRERAARALRRAQRRKAGLAGAPTRARRVPWVGLLAVTAVLLLAGGWWTQHRSASRVQAAPQRALGSMVPAVLPTAAPGPAPTTAATPVEPAVPAATDSTAAVERLRESVEQLAQEDRAKAASLAQQRRQAALDRQRADEARRRTEALAAPAVSPPVAVPEPASPAVAAAAPASPPTAAPRAASVDQLCAGAGNVFARDFCRIRECGQAVHTADPVCVRFRQMDEARRQEAEQR